MFHCTKCGACCRSVGTNDIYKHLADDTGICRYYDPKSRLCTIYEERPLICRVDEGYIKWFKEVMSMEEYYELNYKACTELQKIY